jgi:carboxyl-terminal processing protease
MRFWQRAGTVAGVLGSFGAVTWFTLQFGTGGLWRGLEPAIALPANAAGAKPHAPYDLTRLEAVNETLQHIRDKYVDPGRVRPREMLLAALNRVQQDVAQVIVLHEEGSPEVTVRVETAEKRFRVDNVQGPWDIAARLREIFAFLQEHLRGTEVDLRDVEYAACNGMLRTLDPHSVFLSPEAYREMNVSTMGAFGGLGIVISIREQQLTVMSAMAGTPAGRAGLKRGDKITKINSESTLNMPIDDAVRRLRGEPGTKVTVWVHRAGEGGWAGAKPFELSRESIKVVSVEKQSLDGGIGYVRLKQFQSGTAAELEAALNEFRRKEGSLKGLVIDLRGNPGGLLDQAVKVADLFLKEGTIVSTVGAADAPDEKRARVAGTEPDYPLVVLVNGSSASASEIVAGALKNLDRAVTIGTTTFGKGSVQLIFPDLTADKAALKLTIAQYLTPGNVSIQSVGITPDVELDPMTVDPLEMDLYAAPKVLRERDLSSHLSNNKAREGQKAPYSVRYYMPEGERAGLRARGGDLEDGKFEADFPVRFARELATRMAPGQRRGEQLRALGEYMTQVQRDEVAKAAADLGKLAVDWSEAPSADVGPQARDFEVTASTDRPGDEVNAGEPMSLKVTVKNNGKDPVYRLRAATVSDNGYYDGKELVFGKIAPGQSKTATVPLGFCEPDDKKKPEGKDPVKNPEAVPRACRIPKDSVTRQDGLKVRFESTGDHAPADAEVRPTVRALERPLFAYAYEVVDNRNGANGDGRLQKGEGATLYLTVKNVGKGRSYETQANLSNLSGEGVLLNEGRFDISNMQPGETRRLELTFDVLPSLQDGEAKLRLSVGDLDLHEMASEKVRVAVEPAVKLQAASGAVRAKAQGATLLESPSSGGRAFGRLKPGSALAVKGQVGEFTKVDLGKNRFAFVAANEVEPGGAPSADAHPFEDLLSRSPPNVELKAAQLATRDGKVKLVGSASDNDRVLDAYMFVNSRKVFYRSNRNAPDPKSLAFEQEINLRPGVNVIRFFARENADTVTARTLVVRRDGAGGELLPTPKSDEALFDEGPGGEEPLAPAPAPPAGPARRGPAPARAAPRPPRRPPPNRPPRGPPWSTSAPTCATARWCSARRSPSRSPRRCSCGGAAARTTASSPPSRATWRSGTWRRACTGSSRRTSGRA